MNFEVLKKNHLKRNILIAVVIVFMLSAVILTFTKAKYRTTQSIPLIQGTINFSPSDLNLMAVYLNKNGETISSDKVPHVGYTLNTEQSICEVNDEKDEAIEIVYENGLLNFNGLGNKGTKCTAYFDLIPDSEKPVINNISSKSDNDTSVTIEVNATDNIGIYYYYYKLDNEEEIRSEEASYTFEGLEKDSVHTITVRVEDAAGNEASATDEVTVGLNAGRYILAHYQTVLTRTSFSSTVTNTTTGTIYKSANESQYDDFGEVYYFAGNPTDNWFQFGTNSSGQPLYWRIVRINGDGSIRLIYNGTSTATEGDSTMINTGQAFNTSYKNNAHVGYMYESGQVHGLTTNSSIKTTLDNWYISNLSDEAEYLDGNAGFCGDRTSTTTNGGAPNDTGGTGSTTTYYGARYRLYTNKTPTFKCSDIDNDLYTTPGSSKGNGALIVNNSNDENYRDETPTPIGLITADEVAYAGGVYNQNNTSYYLYNNAYYWTMSPSRFSSGYADVFIVYDNGSLGSYSVDWIFFGVRPVINIRANVEITGSGTTSNPFKIVGA